MNAASSQTQLQLEERRAGKILLDLIDTRAREQARDMLRSELVAALANPDVNDAAKSLAWYMLRRLQDE